jgi:ATP-binding cassette, subfamily B, bacterial MsbA
VANEAAAQPEPKKKRLRGELLSCLRLIPYMRPFKWGITLLVFVTFVHASANAARAWLIMPLFNSILLRGSAVVDNINDQKLADAVPVASKTAALAAATAGWDEKKAEGYFELEDYGLGKLLPRHAPQPLRDDELAKLFQRTRGAITTAADHLMEAATTKQVETGGSLKDRLLRAVKNGLRFDFEQAPDKEKLDRLKGKLAKAIHLQLEAEQLVGGATQLAVAPVASRQLAAALSLEARHRSSEALFSQLFDNLFVMFFAAMFIGITLGTFHFLVFYIARSLTSRMVVDIQNRLAEKLLTLSIRYFNNERRGELFSRLTNDLSQLQSVLMIILSDLLIQPITLAVLIGCAVYQSFYLSLSLGVLAATVFIPVRVWGKRIRRSARSRQASVANVFEAMQQMFAGIRIVKAFRREPYELERFKQRTNDFLVTSLRVVWDRTASKSWMELVNDITIPIVLLVGGTLVIRHQWGLDLGRFGAFLGLVLMMYMPAKTIAASYNTLQDAAPSVDRVFEVLDTKSEIKDAPDAVALGPIRDAIRFEDVTFGYDPARPVLKSVSFTAKQGQVTAIVGPTGGGKSTLVDLVARFYDPTSGRVTIDGVDVKKAKLASLLDKVAVVAQEPFIFNDTIKENIRYGRLDATDAEIEAAARDAQLHDEIVAKKEGYAFIAGERGANLSGGQRQRLTIARAMVKNPEILILDEATSALDANVERKVQEALEKLEKGRTTFVIAHRLSTIQHAHNILVINEGMLVEEGTHDELVAKGGLYASLVKTLAMPGGANSNGNGNGDGDGHGAGHAHEREETA